MILIEITAAISAGGTLQNFYLSDKGFVTAPSHTPANTHFEPALNDPGSLGVHAYSDGRTGGGTRLEVGEIVVLNSDGQFDAWLNYGFDGRPVSIRRGEEGGAYPAGYPAILTGTVDSIEADFQRLVIRLRDKAFILDKPLLSTRYTGANVLPIGLEGTVDDLKGRVKPRVYGKVLNISPPLINTAKLVYQVNTGTVSDIAAVYDRGVALAKGTDHASSTALQAASVSAGTYQTCFGEGFFRLGATPAGTVTADVTQGVAASNRTTAQVLKQIALDVGVAPGDISAVDVVALDTANAAVVGLYVEDEATAQACMDLVAESIGAYYAFDSGGMLRMGRLEAPSGPAVAVIRDYDILDVERRVDRDTSIPVWSVTLGHSLVWTVQATDLATSVTAARRAFLANQYRAEAATDPTVKDQHLLATEIRADTLLTAAADASAEASRRLTLHKVRRDIFDVTVPASFLTETTTGQALQLMNVVTLSLDRFNLAAGRDFRLIGIRVELARDRVVLSLWG